LSTPAFLIHSVGERDCPWSMDRQTLALDIALPGQSVSQSERERERKREREGGERERESDM
jgi:hypothetical protein